MQSQPRPVFVTWPKDVLSAAAGSCWLFGGSGKTGSRRWFRWIRKVRWKAPAPEGVSRRRLHAHVQSLVRKTEASTYLRGLSCLIVTDRSEACHPDHTACPIRSTAGDNTSGNRRKYGRNMVDRVAGKGSFSHSNTRSWSTEDQKANPAGGHFDSQ